MCVFFVVVITPSGTAVSHGIVECLQQLVLAYILAPGPHTHSYDISPTIVSAAGTTT